MQYVVDGVIPRYESVYVPDWNVSFYRLFGCSVQLASALLFALGLHFFFITVALNCIALLFSSKERLDRVSLLNN